MDASGPELCSCMPADAKEALTLVLAMSLEARLLDSSPHDLSIRRCPCGRRYLCAFYEWVDRTDGDDSQATVACPLTASEGVSWTAGDRSVESALRTLSPRRQVLRIRPRRQSAPSVLWIDGPIQWFPHG